MAKVLVTYKIPENGVHLLQEAGYEVTLREEETLISREELIKAVKEYDAILILLTEKIDKEIIDAAGSQLKIIANYAVGYNNIDVKAAKEKGIIITNTPDVLTEAVSEHTIALIGAVSRRIVEADKFIRAGKFIGWRPMLLMGSQIKGKTLGVIGTGRIGAEVAKRAYLGFEVNIAYSDIKPNSDLEKNFKAEYYEDIDEMLPQVDILTLHVPLLKATKHLIDKRRIDLMKDSAIIINTSRGPVIEEEALVIALQNNKLGGAGLDVFEKGHILTPGLTEMNNVVLTPHIASATIEARSLMSELAANNIVSVLSGKEPLTPVA